MATKSLNLIGKESLLTHKEELLNEEETKEIEINEDDEHLGIFHLEKEELIETIKDIREEFFDLQDNHEQLKEKYKEKVKEIENNRKLLTEREDLLLQLQWDPTEDSSYVQQMGASDTNQANELKMKAMMDQMRVMERGVFERDEKIKQMEKLIEQFTLNQINNGCEPTQIVYSQFSTIPPTPTPSQLQFIKQDDLKLQQQQQQQQQQQTPLPNGASSSNSSPLNRGPSFSTNVEDSPSQFDNISNYPLSKKIIDNIEQAVNVIVPSSPSNNLNRSNTSSFWRSPSTFFSNLLGRNQEDSEENNNNGKESIDNENNNSDNDDAIENQDEDEDYSSLDTKPFSVPVELPPNLSAARP
ncbi:hypothetical protein RB653_006164 [Dictyostelium firmibasis]|uniref:Uncharacterized protein n=1 Tax=Dictyostelium firmibasis TaxID=79012 RepID=A0AAN7YYU1_9MYCE